MPLRCTAEAGDYSLWFMVEWQCRISLQPLLLLVGAGKALSHAPSTGNGVEQLLALFN